MGSGSIIGQGGGGDTQMKGWHSQSTAKEPYLDFTMCIPTYNLAILYYKLCTVGSTSAVFLGGTDTVRVFYVPNM